MSLLAEESKALPSGIPWQVKAIAAIGIPGALLTYMIWRQSETFEVNQIQLMENLSLHSTNSVRANEQDIRLIHAIENLKKSIDNVCANTAKTELGRRECFR